MYGHAINIPAVAQSLLLFDVCRRKFYTGEFAEKFYTDAAGEFAEKRETRICNFTAVE